MRSDAGQDKIWDPAHHTAKEPVLRSPEGQDAANPADISKIPGLEGGGPSRLKRLMGWKELNLLWHMRGSRAKK